VYARKIADRNTRKGVRDYREHCKQVGHTPYIAVVGMAWVDLNDGERG
jgi:hypothetical protein